MVDLTEIFMHLRHGLQNGDKRYRVTSDYAVTDEKSGLAYHFHDESTGKPWEIYEGDEVLLTGKELTPQECQALKPAAAMVKQIYADSLRAKLHDTWLDAATAPVATTKESY